MRSNGSSTRNASTRKNHHHGTQFVPPPTAPKWNPHDVLLEGHGCANLSCNGSCRAQLAFQTLAAMLTTYDNAHALSYDQPSAFAAQSTGSSKQCFDRMSPVERAHARNSFTARKSGVWRQPVCAYLTSTWITCWSRGGGAVCNNMEKKTKSHRNIDEFNRLNDLFKNLLSALFKYLQQYEVMELLLHMASRRFEKYRQGDVMKGHFFSSYQHQVAGHTDEPLTVLNNDVVLKPSRKKSDKKMLFLREILVYEEMFAEDGSHLTQSNRPFAAKYYGVLLNNLSFPSSSGSGENNSSSDLSGIRFTKTKSDRMKCISNFLFGMSAYRSSSNVVESSSEGVKISSGEKSNIFQANKLVRPSAYLVIEDLSKGMLKPCVIDIKMGRQTYEPAATCEKIDREQSKYSFQHDVGFRIAGFKVYHVNDDKFISINKKFGRALMPEQVSSGLLYFFYNGSSYRRDVLLAVIQKLEKLLLWLRSQTSAHFYCSSLLIVYDGKTSHITNAEKDVKVNMIDFAHTVPASDSGGGVDSGYIYGVKSLLSYLYQSLQLADKKELPSDPNRSSLNLVDVKNWHIDQQYHDNSVTN